MKKVSYLPPDEFRNKPLCELDGYDWDFCYPIMEEGFCVGVYDRDGIVWCDLDVCEDDLVIHENNLWVERWAE